MMVVVKQSSRHKMWTEITRRKYEREGQRYASDLTDAEWALIEPHMPVAKRLGRPRETALRSVLDPILYIARTGCQWRMLPKDFPPFTTVLRVPVDRDHRFRRAYSEDVGRAFRLKSATHSD